MASAHPFLSDRGEMNELIRSYNWANTSLGEIDTWPQSLKIILGIITHSRFPMFLFWGPELICFYNDAYRPSLGMDGKHPSILGMPAEEAWPEIWPVIKPLIDQVMAGGEATWSEDQLIPIYRNGKMEDVYWTFSYSPAIDESGKPAGIVVTCNETTDKVTTYNKLEESKDQLQFAIEAAELATWDYNPLTNKFTSNARLKKWFGLTPEKEIELQQAIDVIIPRDRERVTRAIADALDYGSGGLYNIEYCIVNKFTKEEVIVQAKGRAWFGDDRKAYRFNGTLQNVTEQVTARNKIAEREQQLRIALEGGQMGTFDYYPETDRLIWSEKTKELFGLPAGADINYKSYLQAIHPEDRKASMLITEQNAGLNKTDLYEIEYRVTGITNGQARWLRSNGKVSYNSSGKPVRYTGVVQDITERKLAEEHRLKLNTILDTSHEFIGLAAADSSMLYANPTAMKKLGWESISGRYIMDCIYPADREYAKTILPELYKSGSFQHEIRFWNEKTGEPFWIQWNGSAIMDASSKDIIGLATVSPDITERKAAEKALKDTEHRLRSLVESAPFPIGVYAGREMRIELVNDSILDTWGRKRDVVGKLFAEVLTELKDQGVFEQLDAVFTTGIPFHAKNEKIDLMIGGRLQPYYFNYSFTPLYDTEGKIYGVLNTAANVTDLNVATQKIEESEKRFRNTVNQAPLGITIFRGEDFLVEMANEIYLQLVDRKKQDFIGKPLFESLPEVKEIVEPLLTEVLKTGNPFFASEFPVELNRYGKQQELSYFNLIYHPLREETDAVTGIMVVATEVTETVKAKQLLAESEKQFRNLVMQSPIAMTIFTGEDHVIEMANDTMLEKIWRKKKEEVIGKKILDAFPELKEQKYAELLGKVYQEGIIYSETESVAFVEGDDGLKKFWLDYEYHPLTESDGTVFAIMITVNDVTEKVEARKKIEENEERLRMAIQSTSLGTWEYFPQLEELSLNEEFRRIYALPLDVAVDFASLTEMIHSSDKQHVEAEMEKAMDPSGNGHFDIEYRVTGHQNKILKWVRAKGKVHFNAQAQAERFVGTVLDITEEKKFQQILEESEQRSRLAIEAAEMGTFDWDLVTNEFISSEKLRAIFGFANNESITHTDLINAFHPDDKPRRDKAVADAASKGSLMYEARVIWQDKSIHWVKVFGKMLFNEQRQPIKMYGTVVDITDEKKNITALQESTARLNIAIEAAELGMWELNLQNHQPYYSNRYLQLLGFANDERPAHNDLISKIHPLDIERRNEAIKIALKDGFLDLEMRLLPAPDTVRWVKAKGKVFYNDEHMPEKMMGTLMDITDTKTTMSVLQESEERFRNIADNAPVLIWMAGTDMGCTFFNTAWLNYTGRSFEQEKGTGWLDGVHAEDIEYCFEEYKTAFDNRQPVYIEYRLKRHDGAYRWVSDKGVPRFTADGVFEGYIGACLDIHDEKLSGEQIQKSELLFKTISNVSPVGLWMTDATGECTFVNDTWINWTGIPYAQQLGKGFLTKMDVNDGPDMYQKFTEAIEKQTRFSSEFRINRPDGSVQWCLNEGSPYYELQGNFAGYAGSVTDITEKKLVEESLEKKIEERTLQLRKSEERNFRMVNEVQDYAILLLSKEGIIENWNKGAEKIKGYSAEEAIGKHFKMFYRQEDQKTRRPEMFLARAIETGRVVEEGWRVKKDGSSFWANVVITALHDNENNIIGFSKVTRDLTERKMAEDKQEESNQRLEVLNAALEKSNSELEQFAYVASHDLQEPLRKIRFFTERLESIMSSADASAQEYFQKIQKSSDRMNTLIRDLLDFSRLSKNSDEFVKTDLNVIFSNICSDFELLIQQKNADVKIDKLPVIDAIPLQMQQLFYNLLSNALKFSKPEEIPVIEVSCMELSQKQLDSYELDEDLSYYLISVKDNGIGFDQAYGEQIFVIFQRLNDLYTYGGTGIGLALCKKIVLNHHGKIFAYGREDEGAEFNIILPSTQKK